MTKEDIVIQGLIMGEGKTRISAWVDDELVEWIDEEVENKTFGNRTHALNYALLKLKESKSAKRTS